MGQWWWLEKRQRRVCELVISSTASPTDLSAFGPIGLVVVQSTSLCNLDCSYCYLPDRQKKRVFDLEMLPLLIQRILESPYAGPEFSLVWHAGEPLTLPSSWYLLRGCWG